MNMLKRIQGFITAFMVCFLLSGGILLPVQADTVDDVPSSWSANYIENLKTIPALGIDKLNSNYQQNITRGEFTYLSVKLYEYYTDQKVLDGIKCFKDTADEWVLKAKRARLVSGYSDQTFHPNDNITREQIVAMFVNVFTAADTLYKEPSAETFSDDNKISRWAKKSVYISKTNGIVNGVGGNIFNPSGLVTREQAFVMLSNAVSSITPNLLRLPKLGIDKIVLRDVESKVVPNPWNSISTNVRLDKTDYPFEPDDSVLGQWDEVAFVSDPLLFSPESQNEIPYYISSICFSESGSVEYGTNYYYINGVKIGSPSSYPAKWTKGLVMENNFDSVWSSRYFIATVDNKAYLFLEWKSGDYIYREMNPNYYVFTKNE